MKYLLTAILCLSAGISVSRAGENADVQNPCSEKYRKRIEKIDFLGLGRTRNFVIKRELLNSENTVFSCDAWFQEKARLEDLDLFAKVSLEISEREDSVLLTYRFVELPGFLIFPAMKKTDQLGWMFGPGFAVFNLFGTDTRIDSYVRTTLLPHAFAATEYQFLASSPWIGSLPVRYNLLMIQNDSYNPLKEYNENSLNSRLDLFMDIQNIFNLVVSGETFTVKHDHENEIFTGGDRRVSEPMFLSSGGRDFVPKLGIGFSFDRRERILNPHRGFYQEALVSKYGGALGGPADYWEYLFDFRGFLPAGERNIFVLSLLGQYRPGRMGAYDFYHVGGANTLRTYDPVSEYFGQHEILGTIEYRFQLFERRPLALFGLHFHYGFQFVLGTDYALLWMEEDNFKEGRSYHSYFAGIHLLLPYVDRFRIEFGFHDIILREFEGKFGLSFGLFEKSIYQRDRVR